MQRPYATPDSHMRTAGTRTPLPVEQPAYDLGVVGKQAAAVAMLVPRRRTADGDVAQFAALYGMDDMGMARDERAARTLAGKL